MTVVADSPQPFTMVPRIEGWRPLNAARIVKAAEPQKQKDCALCNAPAEQHSIVWHAYGMNADVTAAVRAAQEQGIPAATPKLVADHLANHNYEQPAPLKRLSTEEMVFLADQLSDDEKAILMAVYRHRVLSTRQIIDLFFWPRPRMKSAESAKKSAYRTLRKLRFGHFLYPFRTRNKRSPDVRYFLGRHGAPWVEAQEGRLIGQSFVTNRDSLKDFLIEHDILAADVFVQMHRQITDARKEDRVQMVDGAPAQLDMPLDSWWSGQRGLAFGFTNPIDGLEQKLTPDGFATMVVNDGRHRQHRLPFFYEWDSGSKSLDETTEQMANYVAFAMSGVVGKRFPQLNVSDYCPPILLVTKGAQRAWTLTTMIRAACERFGKDSVPPMFVCDVETLRNGALHPGSWHDVHGHTGEGRHTIAEHLLAANGKLNDAAAIHFRKAMVIDMDAAKPKARGGLVV